MYFAAVIVLLDNSKDDMAEWDSWNKIMLTGSPLESVNSFGCLWWAIPDTVLSQGYWAVMETLALRILREMVKTTS